MISGFATDSLAAWQVELMEANARSRQWEELNYDPSESQRKDAVDLLKKAVEKLNEVMSLIIDAETAIDGLPEAKDLEMFDDPIGELSYDIRHMQEKIMKGF